MYIQAEEIALPFRFIFLTGHFIATLAVVFDFDRIVSCVVRVAPNLNASPSDLDNFNSSKQQLEGLAFTAVACLCVEYITLFLGASFFLRRITILNILAHCAGLLLTILFYADCWDIGAYAAFFVVFALLPMLVDVAALIFSNKLALFIRY